MQKLKLGLIFGGRSGEHEVSLESARSILSVLSPERYQVTQIGINRQGQWVTGPHAIADLQQGRSDRLTPVLLFNSAESPTVYALSSDASITPLTQLDVIFPILHGSYGEDGCLQGLCEMFNVPYVGAGVLASAVGMDKALFKDVMRAHGIPILDSLVYTSQQIKQQPERVLDEILSTLGSEGLIFTKPANLGSSVGITRCRTRSELLEGLLEAASYDRRILVERGLVAPREIEVAVLGNDNPQASIAGEIIPGDEFYSYEAKYQNGRSQLLIPAPISDELQQQAQQIALCAYRATDCAGMARVDFLLDRQTDQLYLSEMNTLPGFTPISMYPKLWEASGLPYAKLVDRLIELALERKADRDRTQHIFRSAA
jgi:D-alanine-D-alanine ligase